METKPSEAFQKGYQAYQNRLHIDAANLYTKIHDWGDGVISLPPEAALFFNGWHAGWREGRGRKD